MIHQPHQQQAHTLTSPFARAHLATALIAEARIGRGCSSSRTLSDRWDRNTDGSKEERLTERERERERERWREGIKRSLQWGRWRRRPKLHHHLPGVQAAAPWLYIQLSLLQKKKQKKTHTPQKIQPCQPASAHSLTLQYVCVCVSVCVCEEFLSNFQQVSIKMTGTTNEFCCAIWN